MSRPRILGILLLASALCFIAAASLPLILAVPTSAAACVIAWLRASRLDVVVLK